MPENKQTADHHTGSRAVAEARRAREMREKSYRERALKLFPWVCGRCGREFSGKKLRELTVHHRDHNHDNNPPDGSNWKLLCIYCHENEHSRHTEQDAYGGASGTEADNDPGSSHRPFADLAALLQEKEKK